MDANNLIRQASKKEEYFSTEIDHNIFLIRAKVRWNYRSDEICLKLPFFKNEIKSSRKYFEELKCPEMNTNGFESFLPSVVSRNKSGIFNG